MTEFDVLGDHLVVGNNNGTLAVWDLDSKQMTVNTSPFSSRKQYFCTHLCFWPFGLEGLPPFLYQKKCITIWLRSARLCLGDEHVHWATSHSFCYRKVLFRCASISWFQVVSQWVSDVFRLAHLRVFQSYFYLSSQALFDRKTEYDLQQKIQCGHCFHLTQITLEISLLPRLHLPHNQSLTSRNLLLESAFDSSD